MRVVVVIRILQMLPGCIFYQSASRIALGQRVGAIAGPAGMGELITIRLLPVGVYIVGAVVTLEIIYEKAGREAPDRPTPDGNTADLIDSPVVSSAY